MRPVILILPNELADTYSYTGLKLSSARVQEPDYGAKRHALAEISCMKRDPGAYAYDFFHARLMARLAGAVTLTFMPEPGDWQEVTGCAVRRGWLKGAEGDMLSDARANRAALLADERFEDTLACSASVTPDVKKHMADLEPARRTWKWAKWYQLQCPCCVARGQCREAAEGYAGGVVQAQTRWHILTKGSLAQVEGAAEQREKAVAWLDRNLEMFVGGQAGWALAALRGEGDRRATGCAQMSSVCRPCASCWGAHERRSRAKTARVWQRGTCVGCYARSRACSCWSVPTR